MFLSLSCGTTPSLVTLRTSIPSLFKKAISRKTGTGILTIPTLEASTTPLVFDLRNVVYEFSSRGRIEAIRISFSVSERN